MIINVVDHLIEIINVSESNILIYNGTKMKLFL